MLENVNFLKELNYKVCFEFNHSQTIDDHQKFLQKDITKKNAALKVLTNPDNDFEKSFKKYLGPNYDKACLEMQYFLQSSLRRYISSENQENPINYSEISVQKRGNLFDIFTAARDSNPEDKFSDLSFVEIFNKFRDVCSEKTDTITKRSEQYISLFDALKSAGIEGYNIDENVARTTLYKTMVVSAESGNDSIIPSEITKESEEISQRSFKMAERIKDIYLYKVCDS